MPVTKIYHTDCISYFYIVLTTESTWIKQEDICALTEKQNGVQCPHCHNCFCCKQCDEKQEKIQHLEKYNNELEIDLESKLQLLTSEDVS